MKKAGRYLLKGLGILLALPLLYLLAAFIGSVIPVNTSAASQPQDLEIYIRTNGVHTSLLMPKENSVFDWTEIVKPQHTLSQGEPYNYVSFGWGDLEFYENTPAWEDLTLPVAFRALFLKTPAALNVEFFQFVPQDGKTFLINLSTEEYRKLVSYIQQSFEYGPDGKAQHIAQLHYNQKDVFYKAKRHLNLFYTCNTWTNNGLKEAGLEACLWTPFEEGIIFRYR